MLEFEWPWIFVLLPLPALVWWLVPRADSSGGALLVPFFEQVQPLANSEQSLQRSNLIAPIMLVLIWLALIIACARPQWVGEPVELPASGRDLLLAVDISGSMDTRDMIVNGESYDRLTVVKAVIGEFVQRRHQDRLGLILFGTNAYLQSPLTFDRKTVNILLQEAQLGFAGEKTAIGEAIGLAIKRLQNRPQSSRVVILLTDGANTAGEVAPLQAAELAKLAEVKIYTIGVGADEITMRGLFSRGRTINPSRDLDEDTLTDIAELTGGQYFRARDPKELVQIYDKLDELEPVEQEAETFRPIQALFYWPLGLAVLLSSLLALRKVLVFYRHQRTNNPILSTNRTSES